VTVSGQTYPRKIDFLVTMVLSSIAASLHKFAFDMRIQMSPNVGEWAEEKDAKRVGSSAMPFKKNPDKAEKVCSLCRYVASLLSVSWSNPANSLLERTLDDSASQRIFLPESFLAIDECLTTMNNLLNKLVINEAMVAKNLTTYGVFSAAEPLLMALVKKGGDRQKLHELIKEKSMEAWKSVHENKGNPFLELLAADENVQKLLSKDEMMQYVDPSNHLGLAKERTQKLLSELQKVLD
ncbi:MAG: lyase family protein, partial [Candidatus Levyibacteriota bacterium]